MHSRTVPAIVLLFAAMLQAGCGNIQTVKSFSTPYEQPATGDRARIRVVADGMVRAVPNSACEDWRLPGSGVMVAARKGFADQNNRSLGMPGADSAPIDGSVVSEFYVPAGKPLMLSYLSNGRPTATGSAQCFMRKSFVPMVGEDYEARFRHVGSQCHGSVTTLQSHTGQTIRSAPLPLAEAPFCRVSDNL